MKKIIALALLSTLPLLAKVEDKETIRQTYAVSKGLDVTLINGKIRVLGGTSSSMEVEAIKTVRADDQTALDQGKREMRLNMDTNGERLRICEEGPWGGCDQKNGGCRGDCHREYSVHFDVTIRMPAGVNVKLRNVNGGIEVNAVTGNFDVRTVNGGASLLDAAGSGSIHSVNGALHLSFTNAPTGSVEARTVNGAIEAAFPRSANALLSFKTVHGGVYTNMSTETVQQQEPPAVERSNGRTRYKAPGHFSVKLGAGGPSHSFETVNGSIQIKERN